MNDNRKPSIPFLMGYWARTLRWWIVGVVVLIFVIFLLIALIPGGGGGHEASDPMVTIVTYGDGEKIRVDKTLLYGVGFLLSILIMSIAERNEKS